MTMYTAIKSEPEAESNALFFGKPCESADQSLVETPQSRTAYGAARKPNWPAVVAIVLLHITGFYALVKLDIVRPAPQKKPIVVELIAEAPVPPIEQPKPEPVKIEKARPVAVNPPPIVQTPAATPPPIMVTATPPTIAPAVTAQAPTAAPVAVSDLEERLVDYQLPRYPLESRRKKEHGTLLVRLLIGRDGRVAEASIARSCGFPRLDEAFLQAVRKWRWRPELRDGEPVEVRGVMPFTWNIV